MSKRVIVHSSGKGPRFGLLVRKHRLMREGVNPEHFCCPARTFSRLCREGYIEELC